MCEEVGITEDQCHARLLPHEKLEWITTAESRARTHVLMIGDGINDAAALAGVPKNINH